MLSVKIKPAKYQKMKQGKYLGGHVPYSLMKDPKDKHKLIVDPEAAAVVREIFDMAIAKIDNFNDTYLDQEEIKSKVSSICGKYWNKVYEIIEKDFPDAYPAYLFKNVGRLKEIIKKI